MAASRPSFLAAIAAAAALLVFSAQAAEPLRVGEAVLEPIALTSLPGFEAEDHAAALDTFRLTCNAPRAGLSQLASVHGSMVDLTAACDAARTVPREKARAFFESAFTAYRVTRPARVIESERRAGFLTGYFEPELAASLVPGPGFTAAALGRPDDLVAVEPGQTPPGLDPSLRFARRTPTGLEPYPDRAAIEDGALGDRARPVLWLRDPVDLFVLQVQGSGRVRLPDGRSLRVRYDGKNGRPYSSVVKTIVTEGHLPLEGLTFARWAGWLRAHPTEARRLMRTNAAYVFFKVEEATDVALGPPGGAGVPLTPGRSLAVDATLWRYGLPFWLDGQLSPDAGQNGRLVVAQDTGSAIVGPARGDLYLGTGDAAGAAAGNLRHAISFVVLLPKPASPPASADAR
ncbi:murein transglycosylase A [Methylobacterium sp. C25]|uniref:murein transglycosylase A n=1 Tax=Methylobacterium sp. C25 TaxID=2721622 RepID=UPI001F15CE7B|nr:murein transglycosylase A [Methylobacterium sp. C25]MCE4224407.1 murein transglycosylase A [Methylobacterium sp. C25]